LGIGWLKTQEMTRYFFDEIDPLRLKGNYGGHAHSNFFEMLGGTGLIGLTAFLAWSWFTLSLANRLRKRFLESGDAVLSDLCFGILVALILLHVNGLTNVNFWEGKVMHQQMLAIAILLVLDRRLNLKKA
jgi:O-antigen ligase